MTSTERGSYNEGGSYKCDGIPMDPLITTAARALAAGDPLGALKRVALRDDPPALALRGIAMAQLGDLVRAKTLLRRAARAFGPKEAVARARCVVAEAEIALVSRDLGWPGGIEGRVKSLPWTLLHVVELSAASEFHCSPTACVCETR